MPQTLRSCWLFGLLLCAALLDARAQTATVRGFVVDAANGQPLQRVNVVLLDGTVLLKGTATDGNGYFILTGAPAIPLVLQATSIGYAPFRQALRLEAGALRTLRLALQPSETAIDELLVEAERTGSAVTTAGLQTVRPADLARLPIPGVTGDLVAQLQVSPSFTSVGDRGGLFYMRGGEPTQNLALLDGIPLYQPFHILSFYSAFPAEIVNDANVYAGGFGARYGGRLSSVIDVAARNGNKQQLEASASVAPFLSTLQVEGPLLKGRASALISLRESLIEQVMPTLYGQKIPYRFGDQFAKAHAQPAGGVGLSFTALHTHDRGDIAGTRRTVRGDPAPEAPSDSTEVGWQNLAFGTRLLLLPGRLPVLAELTASFSRLDADLGRRGDPEREAGIEGYGAEFTLAYLMRGRAARLGFFAWQTTLSYRLGGLFQEVEDVSEGRLAEAGAFLELDLRGPGGLQLTPGLRLHSFPNRERVTLEPRLRAAFPFTGRAGAQQLAFAAGLYHQGLLGLTDERDAGSVFTAWAASPEEEPVPQALHLILGWQAHFEPHPQTLLRLSAEAYHKRLKDLFVPRWDPFPQFTTSLQHADGRVSGFDARAELVHPVFYGYVGYGLAETVYLAQDDVFGTYYGTPQDRYHPPHDRRHQLSVVGRVMRGSFAVSAQWQYGSGLPFTRALGFDDWLFLSGEDVDLRSEPGRERVLYEVPYASRLPAYHRLDLWLERTFAHGRLSGLMRAGVVNAYNRDNLFYFDLFTLKRVEQLPLIPSVGLKLSFR